MKNENHIDIEHLMMLARIELTEQEKIRITDSLNSILEYFKELSDIDVTGIEESAHAFPVYNVLREDEADTMLSTEEALLNAPEKRDNQFVVPKIVE